MKKQTMLRIGSVVVIVILGFLGMTMLSSTDKHSNKRKIDPEIRTIETQTVSFGDYTLQVEGNGVVESQKTLNIVSEAAGQVVFAKNDLKDGTYASKGEVILKIDPREVQNNLYSLRSDFMNAVASVLPELKIENTETYSNWYKYFNSLDVYEETPDLPEAENSQIKIKISTRKIYNKFYMIKNQEILLSKHTITAPFDGFIKSNGIIENSYVSRGMNVLSIIDAKNLEIAVPLIVDEFQMISLSTNPQVKIYPEKESDNYILGKVNRNAAKIDRNSQTINTYVSFKNSNLNPLFLPGNYVKVVVNGDKLKNVAAIPRYTINEDNYVFTMEEEKLNRRQVDVAAIQNDLAIIRNNIPESTKLVTTILQKPLIGMAVQSLNEAHATDEIDKSDETLNVVQN